MISPAGPSLGKSRREPRVCSSFEYYLQHQLLEFIPSRIQHQPLLCCTPPPTTRPTDTNQWQKQSRLKPPCSPNTCATPHLYGSLLSPNCPSQLLLLENNWLISDFHSLSRLYSTRSSTPSTSSFTKPSAPSSAASSKPRPRPSAFRPLPAMRSTGERRMREEEEEMEGKQKRG